MCVCVYMCACVPPTHMSSFLRRAASPLEQLMTAAGVHPHDLIKDGVKVNLLKVFSHLPRAQAETRTRGHIQRRD